MELIYLVVHDKIASKQTDNRLDSKRQISPIITTNIKS